MMRQLILLFSAFLVLSCAATKSGGKICYKNFKTIRSIEWTEKIVFKNFLKLKKGNYFLYYQKLPVPGLGINTSKLIEYRGSYLQRGDTILFNFCGDTIPKPMTEKVVIDTTKKQIIFLLGNPNLDQHFKINIQ